MSHSSSHHASYPRIGYKDDIDLVITPEDEIMIVTAIHSDLVDEISDLPLGAYNDAIARHNIRDPRGMAFKYAVYQETDFFRLKAAEITDHQIIVVGSPFTLDRLEKRIPNHYSKDLFDFSDAVETLDFRPRKTMFELPRLSH